MPKRMRKRSTPAPEGHLLFQGGGLFMSHTVCVFSDESGVFDKGSNKYFVFGGLILDAGKKKCQKFPAYTQTWKIICAVNPNMPTLAN